MSKNEIMEMDKKQLLAAEAQLRKSLKSIKIGTIKDSVEAREIWNLMWALQTRLNELEARK